MASRNLSRFLSSNFIIILLFILLSCDLENIEELHFGRCVPNVHFLMLYGLSVSDCVSECQLRPSCVSLNYKIDTKRCDINDINAPLLTQSCPGFIFSKRSIWKKGKLEVCEPRCTAAMRCNKTTATCEKRECGLFPVVQNAVILGNRRSVGNKMLYLCETDRTAVFPVRCLDNGEWSSKPVCPVVPFVLANCGEPSPQTNSYVLPGNNTIGSRRQYQCNAQYVPTPASDDSSMTVTCQSSGDWTKADFVCVIDCKEPTALVGESISPGETMYGSFRIIQCVRGYRPKDSRASNALIRCDISGNWFLPNAAFKCLRECPEPATKANAKILPGPTPDVSVEGEKRTYKCEPGYTPLQSGSDALEITCQADGDWSESNLVCVIVSKFGLDCSNDSNCLEANNRCVYNHHDHQPRWRCLCDYRTEFNYSSSSCDLKCDINSNSFEKVPNVFINQYNLGEHPNKTADECKQLCNDTGDSCASVDHWRTENTCYINTVTYQQILDGDPTQVFSSDEFDIYTRTCDLE